MLQKIRSGDLLERENSHTNDSQVADFGIQRSPAKTSKLDISVEHLSGRLVQKSTKNNNGQKCTDVQEISRCNSEALNNEIGDEEI